MVMVDAVPIWEAGEATRQEWPRRGRVRVWAHVRGAKGKVKGLCEGLLEGGWVYKVQRTVIDVERERRQYWGKFEADWRMANLRLAMVEAYVVEYWREGEGG